MAVQRNVHQQNALSKERMQQCAARLDADEGLLWLRALLQQRGLSPEQGVLVSLADIPDQAGTYYTGVWVGQDQRFWGFQATVSTGSSSVVVESFDEISSEVLVTKNGRGKGSSFGQLAIEVLRESLAPNPANATRSRRASEA